MNFDIKKKNFIDLNYNLYEILNLNITNDISKIKKNLHKVLKTYHPDKNCNIEIDIFYHFIICKKILLNIDNKREYDDFLCEKNFISLKDNFKKDIVEVNTTKTFKEREIELNVKHNYIKKDNYENIMQIYEKLNRNDIIIDKNNNINDNTFNKIFEKENNINNKNSECTDIIIKPVNLIRDEITYTSIDNIDKLYEDYSDDGNITNFFSYNNFN